MEMDASLGNGEEGGLIGEAGSAALEISMGVATEECTKGDWVEISRN